MNIEEGVFRNKVYKIEGQKDVSKIKLFIFFKNLEKKSSSRTEKSAVIGMYVSRNEKDYFFFC